MGTATSSPATTTEEITQLARRATMTEHQSNKIPEGQHRKSGKLMNLSCGRRTLVKSSGVIEFKVERHRGKLRLRVFGDGVEIKYLTDQ